MATPDWLLMLDHLQELHRLSRSLLSHKQALPQSELELLSLVYLAPEGCTPLFLSQQTGMKKEAVSRGLRHLFAREALQKLPNPEDERSYVLSLTEAGHKALHESYGPMLQPLYELRRRMGPDFDTLFSLLKKANTLMK